MMKGAEASFLRKVRSGLVYFEAEEQNRKGTLSSEEKSIVQKMMDIKRNQKIDLLRTVFCVAVLLYHLELLKGGYLAVCGFFVLSGYYMALSLIKRKDEEVFHYQLKRILKIYIPLAVTVFLTVLTVSVLPSAVWISLKPETTSVLLGYNNIWQISALQDYFARANTSPLIHMWYLSILLQYDLVFPIAYIIGRKLHGKDGKGVLCLIAFALGIVSFALFEIRIGKGEVMSAYYGTFSRLFSLLLGSSVSLFHTIHRPLVFEEKTEKVLYTAELILLGVLFVFTGTDPKTMGWAMLGTTVLTMRLIEHSLSLPEEGTGSFVTLLSGYSYEIYLLQYPLIFLWKNTGLPSFVTVPLIVVMTLLLSIVMKNALDLEKIAKKRPVNIVLCILTLVLSLCGCGFYWKTQDHTEEMKELEERLNENEKLIEEKNQEYMSSLDRDKKEWAKLYEDSENREEAVREILKQMPVVGIGDSILLDAVPDLYELFPNGYFDAKISRNLYVGEQILEELIEEGKLGDTVILCLATNGDYTQKRNERLMEILGDRDVFWIDAVGADDPSFNGRFAQFAENYDNLHIVPWEAYSKGHPEWFYVDGIHVVGRGVREFAELIYRTVYQVKLDEFDVKMKEAIAAAEAEDRERIAFYGNKSLLNIYGDLSELDKAIFHVKEDYDPESLYAQLKEDIAKDMEHNVVFLFDKEAKMTDADYERIADLCKDHRIYLCDLNEDPNISRENVTVISFQEELKEHDEYLSPDRIHLSEEGNRVLVKKILDTLKNEE